jgi:hypothetical protein
MPGRANRLVINVSRPLRIFLCCQQSARRHAVPAYGFWAEYFRGACSEAGYECLEATACDWAEGLLPLDRHAAAGWRERTWQTAVDFIRREHDRAPIDFFLGYLFPRQVLPGALGEIRSLGIPCVNFFCDNVREFHRVPDEFRGFDLHWVPEHKAIELYKSARLPFLQAPMACWVPPNQRAPVEHESLPITFVGTRDIQRERLFAAAIRSGLAINLHGTGWESGTTAPSPPPRRARHPVELARRQFHFARQHGWPALVRKHAGGLLPPSGVDFDFTPYARPAPIGSAYWTALRESTVCLGVNRYPSWRFPIGRPDTYSRLRDIEAPMAGACYLTEWTAGLQALFELGSEIETYHDASELVDKCRILAIDTTRRRQMRIAAQRHALAEHSIHQTLQRIAARLNCPA